MTDPAVEDLKSQYTHLLHAVQSGVKAEIELAGTGDTAAAGPKHLRVGVNSALIQNSALAHLLIEGGIITERAYWEKQVELWREEVRSFEQRLSALLGKKITLA